MGTSPSEREPPTPHVGDSLGDRAAVAAALTRLSAAWQNRRYDQLAEAFDEQVVMVLPGFSGRVEGRGALVESYREFTDRATLTQYDERPPAIDVWGDTAVASYRWEMSWLTDNVSNYAAGHDLFVFRRVRASSGSDAWRAVWRTMTFESDTA